MSGCNGLVIRVITTTACLCAIGLGLPAAAQDSEAAGKLDKFTVSESIRLESLAFFRYWYDLEDSAVEDDGQGEPHDNSFEMWRFYFGVKAQVTPWLKARFTADVGADRAQTSSAAEDGHTHKTTGDPRYGLFIKYAWLEAEPVDGLYLKAGVIENPYHSFTDKLWGYRYVFMNLGDEEKLWHSADVGAYLRYELPSGLGDVMVGVVNGSGYKNVRDTDDVKDLWVQAWLHPLKPLGGIGERFVLGAYLDYSLAFSDDEDKRLFYTGLLGYKSELFTLAYQFVGQSLDAAGSDGSVDGMGHGAYLRVDTPWNVGLLARFVMWDADTSSDVARTKQQYLAGLSYSPDSLFSVAASMVYTTWSEVFGDPMEDEITILLSSQLSF